MNGFACENLYREGSLREFLREFGVRPDKNLGQHFLVDRSVLESISKSAGNGDAVVEVGPGVGSLTCLLKEQFDRVYGVELEGKFEKPFNAVNPEERVKFIRGDVLDLDFSYLEGIRQDRRVKLVGNIPYNITGKLMQKTIAWRDYFSRAVFTLQKEVADRILAEPGTSDCGRLTYHVRAYGEVDRLMDVHPDKFYPPPEVESTAVVIDLKRSGEFEIEEEFFSSLLRGVFLHRRKTIRNGLTDSPEFSLDRDQVDSLLDGSEIDPRKRPEEFSLDEFVRLAKSLRKLEAN
ncbi:ribosomal RNA small subunit methyltransferase A [Candidatus Bipolaricaulota bacterium]|nr:ribosomal RNA small subunit methyltransferase A [Candidatus Bipolaricaulota bacterium]